MVRDLAERIPTFANVVIKWEQNNEPPPAANSSTETENGVSPTTNRPVVGAWSGQSSLDADEESYFNESDEDDESSAPPSTLTETVKSGMVRSPAVIFKEMREKGKDRLVDYEDDDLLSGPSELKRRRVDEDEGLELVLNKKVNEKSKPTVNSTNGSTKLIISFGNHRKT